GQELHLLVLPELTSSPSAGVPHDTREQFMDVLSRCALRLGGHRPREPRTPPSTPCPPAIRGPTPSVSMGSRLLGLVVTGLGELAVQSHHRAARDRSGVAPPRLPALLAREVQTQTGRPAETRSRASPADPSDG